MVHFNDSENKALVIAGHADSLINFRKELLAAMIASGFKVYVVAPKLLSNSIVSEELGKLGCICYDATFSRVSVNPFSETFAVFQLLRIFRLVRPSLVFGYTIKPVIYGSFCAALTGVPHRFALITGLGYAFTGEVKGLRFLVSIIAKSLYRGMLGLNRLVFFQNPDDEAMAREISLLGTKTRSLVVNGSGVDVERFPYCSVSEEHMEFLLIARLLGDKGVREFAQAAKIVKERYPKVLFTIVGYVDENPDSISLSEINYWVKTGVISYLGKLEDVRPVIERSTVYVLPSYREGTPRTVLEAMSMGRPIITTDAPGCRETVVDGYNGFLVPVKSVPALVEAMIKFINNPNLMKQMGIRSRQIAEDKYDVRKVNAVMLSAMGITRDQNNEYGTPSVLE